MPSFKEQIDLDLDVFVNPEEFGVFAVYKPVLDDPIVLDQVSCNVIIEHDAVLQPAGYDAQVLETGTTIEALYRDVAEPQMGSIFIIDGVVWEVERITDNDREFVKVVVTQK